MDRVLIVINKDENKIGPSETFLRAHIDKIPAKITTLIGNPGFRCINEDKTKYLTPRTTISLAIRWLYRKLFRLTVQDQDTAALTKFIKKNKFSAVLAEYGMTGVSIMDACKRTKVPLIVHFHGYDAYQKNIIDSLLQSYKKLFEISSKIIAVSSDMKNQLINLGCPESKVFVNPCGATIRSELSKQINYNLQQFIMVGRLVEKKAPFVSIIAFSRVLEKYKHAKLEIIGDGHLLDACKQLVKSLNMRNNVVFYGSQEHSFVLEKMSKSSCFIQHSVTAESGDKEGTPVGVLEAMGMGLPVVSTKHGGISDIIEHTKTGFLVNEYDLDDMVKFMLEITNNVELAKSVGTAASDTVEKKYSLNHSISRLWSIISDAIEDKQ